MTDRVRALLAEAPGLELASQIAPARLPVPEALESILPFGGLRLGTTVGITGVGATSLALALVSCASREHWTAAVGLSDLSLPAAAELSVDLDRLVVVPDPGEHWIQTLAAVIDSFDVVLTSQLRGVRGAQARHAGAKRRRTAVSPPIRLAARVRERDAVLISIGGWPECDLTIHGTSAKWHGIGHGHGHLQKRTLEVTVNGRGSASRLARSTLLLPDEDGHVALVTNANVVTLRRSG
jgi:hypothetical protein